MSSQIGSEFFLDNTFLTENIVEINKTAFFTSSGRDALKLLLQFLKQEMRISGKVLLPAYICDSVVNPFIENGFECFFYDISFTNNEQTYYFPNSLLDFDIIFVMRYFGLDISESSKELIKAYSEDETVIIEDTTHSFFNDEKLSEEFDSFQIASIRKWFGVPTGGYLYHDKIDFQLKYPNLLVDETEFMKKRLIGLTQKALYMENPSNRGDFRELFDEAELYLNRRTDIYKIDSVSMSIIKKNDYEKLKERRKRNYDFLAKELVYHEGIELPFPKRKPKQTPLFLPVFITDGKNQRNSIQKHLASNNIFCPIHWPIPSRVNTFENKRSMYIYDHILSLPIDQRYTMVDMLRISEVLKNYRRNE